jgi:hypothetical protein
LIHRHYFEKSVLLFYEDRIVYLFVLIVLWIWINLTSNLRKSFLSNFLPETQRFHYESVGWPYPEVLVSIYFSAINSALYPNILCPFVKTDFFLKSSLYPSFNHKVLLLWTLYYLCTFFEKHYRHFDNFNDVISKQKLRFQINCLSLHNNIFNISTIIN